MPEQGEMAPDFTLTADDGTPVSLSDFRGRKVVLYFYPKDNTSGCTTQACDLRDSLPELEEVGAVVLGVSPDSQASHESFKSKYDLNFPLLVDADHTVSEAYGVWKEKSMYGRSYMGVERSTFIIDEEGRIEAAWRKVKAGDHAGRVLEHLRA